MVSSICRGIALIALAALLLPSGCSNPKKEMVIEHVAIPKAEGVNAADTAFVIYYVWDGKKDKLPWWVVMKLVRDREATWVVGEIGNQYHDGDEFRRIMSEARPLSPRWLDEGLSHLRRTTAEKMQHAQSGSDALPAERKAIAEVVRLAQAIDDHSATPGTGNSGDATGSH
jgi:hypothetical protein